MRYSATHDILAGPLCFASSSSSSQVLNLSALPIFRKKRKEKKKDIFFFFFLASFVHWWWNVRVFLSIREILPVFFFVFQFFTFFRLLWPTNRWTENPFPPFHVRCCYLSIVKFRWLDIFYSVVVVAAAAANGRSEKQDKPQRKKKKKT